MLDLKVGEDIASQRLDQFVAAQIPEMSRAVVQRLIKRAEITVNGLVQKPSYILQPGDSIAISTEMNRVVVSDIKLPLVYEDDDCLVIDKPVGVLTHSKGAFNPEATVATFVRSLSDKVEDERSGIVHRLDRATSGVMICAKTPEALSWLQKQFSTRKVKKKYVAITAKTPNPQHAIIDMPIERNPKKPQTFRVGANGKPATTEYKVLSSTHNHALIELSPTTGRTHQLRVHLANMGCPILGDTLYGGSDDKRMYLHALSLEITLPNSERRVFEAKLPDSFKEKMSE